MKYCVYIKYCGENVFIDIPNGTDISFLESNALAFELIKSDTLCQVMIKSNVDGIEKFYGRDCGERMNIEPEHMDDQYFIYAREHEGSEFQRMPNGFYYFEDAVREFDDIVACDFYAEVKLQDLDGNILISFDRTDALGSNEIDQYTLCAIFNDKGAPSRCSWRYNTLKDAKIHLDRLEATDGYYGIKIIDRDGLIVYSHDQEQDPEGAKRNNSGKPRLGLIPLITMIDEAKIWEAGIAEYGTWNWTKGMPWMVVIDSILRHLARFQAGEDVDPKSGLSHMHHVACNVRMLCAYEREHPELDDRPKGLFDKFLEMMK